MNKIINFGCRLNASESEKIDELTSKIGLTGYTIINSCAVTAEAERKLRQVIRKLFNEDHSIKIILTGCASEINADYYSKMPGVVGIISNNLKLNISSYENFVTERKICEYEKKALKIRGFLQIQSGCDNLCTYCVVRFTRGKSVSFDRESIVSEAKELLRRGYKEIVLTGVNISRYAKEWGQDLASLIRYILKEVPNLQRLRLSSLDPADINDELIKVIGNEKRLMPHIHESIQSGDDIILQRMMRTHNRSQVIELNQKILEAREDIIFGADIIVGFPTETDEMFLNSKKLLTDANLSLLHIFPFSARKLTPAAKMPQILRSIKFLRAKDLRNEANLRLNDTLLKYIGKPVNFIAETEHVGRTDNFLSVKVEKNLNPGEIYSAICSGVRNKKLIVNL